MKKVTSIMLTIITTLTILAGCQGTGAKDSGKATTATPGEPVIAENKTTEATTILTTEKITEEITKKEEEKTTDRQTEKPVDKTQTTTTGKIEEPTKEPGKSDGAVWKEIPLEYGVSNMFPYRMEFDFKKVMTGNDYIFSGTIISSKEYEIEYFNEKGEKEGPYKQSILEVKINKEYYGKSPTGNDIIKVLPPVTLSCNVSGDIKLRNGFEYLFMTKFFDEKHEKDKREPNKHADIVLRTNHNHLMLINDDIFIMNKGYFKGNDELAKKTISESSLSSEITDIVSVGGSFIALKREDFEKAFLEILKNPEYFPEKTN